MESLEGQYGFDENIFISDVPDYLHCMLCSLVLRNPVQILACGHKMCYVCFCRIKTHSTTTKTELRCPIDRDLVDTNDVREDKYLKRVIGNMVVRCCHHDQGCDWSGDLSELDTHFAQCLFKALQQRNDNSQSISLDTVKDLSNRLEQCESSLIDKNKEIVLLQHQLQEQQQLKEEVRLLKQQQQEGVADLQKKNTVLEQKISELAERNLELRETKHQQQQDIANLLQKNEVFERKVSEVMKKNMDLQEKQQQLEKLQNHNRKEINDLKGISEAQKLEMNKLTIKIETLERCKAPSGIAAKNFSSNGASCTRVAKEQPAVIPKKIIVFEHRCGNSSTTTVDNDNHSVVFHSNSRGKFATVTARSVVVPPHTKVWYEVEYTHYDAHGWNIVGWATPDLPTSQTWVNEWVGNGTHSYGFEPFDAYKWHNGGKRWGKKFTGVTGVVGVALDLVKGEILFSIGGQWTTPMGVAFTDVPTQKKFFPAITGWNSTLTFNFGDRSFKHGPPDSTYKTVINVFE